MIYTKRLYTWSQCVQQKRKYCFSFINEKNWSVEPCDGLTITQDKEQNVESKMTLV